MPHRFFFVAMVFTAFVLSAMPLAVARGDEPPWGEAVDGVQARLVADKLQWKADEFPTVVAEIRNTGENEHSFLQSGCSAALQIDGQWYSRCLNISEGVAGLGPGQHHGDMRFTLDGQWKESRNLMEGLTLAPGKHVVRVRLLAEKSFRKGDDTKAVSVLSNPVEFEMLAVERTEAEVEAVLASPGGRRREGALAEMAKFRTKTAFDAVAAFASSRDVELRAIAADALGSPVGRADAARVYDLLARLLDDREHRVCVHAGFALGRLGDARAVALLKARLKDSPLVFAESLWRLGEPFDPAWITPVIKAKEEGENDWQNALHVMSRYGGIAGAKALVGCLEVDDPSVNNYYNYTVTWQIGSCGGPNVEYTHDFDDPGTPEQRQKNAELMRQLREWAAGGKAPPNRLPPTGWIYEEVQVELAPDKVRWTADETPTFKLTVRNASKEKVRLVLSPENVKMHVFTNSGVWRQDDFAFPARLTGAGAGVPMVLEPGAEAKDVPVSFDEKGTWRRGNSESPLGLWREMVMVSAHVLVQPANGQVGQSRLCTSGNILVEIAPPEAKR